MSTVLFPVGGLQQNLIKQLQQVLALFLRLNILFPLDFVSGSLKDSDQRRLKPLSLCDCMQEACASFCRKGPSLPPESQMLLWSFWH